MRKMKSQKGITLIALIITIIVLLILAVVAIGAVQNDGIINHAKNSTKEYKNGVAKENEILQNYVDFISEKSSIDIKKIEWLEDYLNNYKGTVVNPEEYYEKSLSELN